MNSPIYWLIIMAVLIIIEILTLGLTSIWFAAGAFVAFMLSLFVDSLLLEAIVALVVAFFLLFYTRPWLKKHFVNDLVKTNYESLIGRDGKVTETINNLEGCGTVNLNGQMWTARSVSDDIIIKEGTIVTVVRIQGVKLIVEAKVEG